MDNLFLRVCVACAFVAIESPIATLAIAQDADSYGWLQRRSSPSPTLCAAVPTDEKQKLGCIVISGSASSATGPSAAVRTPLSSLGVPSAYDWLQEVAWADCDFVPASERSKFAQCEQEQNGAAVAEPSIADRVASQLTVFRSARDAATRRIAGLRARYEIVAEARERAASEGDLERLDALSAELEAAHRRADYASVLTAFLTDAGTLELPPLPDGARDRADWRFAWMRVTRAGNAFQGFETASGEIASLAIDEVVLHVDGVTSNGRSLIYAPTTGFAYVTSGVLEPLNIGK